MALLRIPYFPKELKYASPLMLAGAGFLFYFGHALWAVFVVALVILIFTTHYVTEVNPRKKNFRDFLSVAGMRLNVEVKPFQVLDKIVITKGSYSQAINTRVQSRQLDWTDYTATLVMDNGTLNLLTRNDKALLIQDTKPFAQ